LADTVAAIYEAIFKTSAPRLDPTAPLAFLSGLDTLPDRLIFKETSKKINHLLTMTKSVDDNFREIARLVDSAGFVPPPMSLPMKNVSFAQVGASVGMKMNPFYQVPIMHEGLDIIAVPGEVVYAAAPGVVSDVTLSRKGLGNVVTIKHKGGYATRYAHLGNIYVDQGVTVRRGQRIGDVGSAGNSSYAPHLHYVIRKDTLFLDPVHYFYASITPDVYMNMLIMSAKTGQSMD
jgi:murein DD-endopeptidase MepM/ murein hydrolase activator NlpD